MDFIHDDFLLHSKTARNLYHTYAAHEPILDYHSHLVPADIAGDRRFRNLSEPWLEDDHYKWRAMRANGIPESCITGDAAPYDKFLAWARTVPFTLRNPLYHWTHLELKRYFGIDELLDETTAGSIWERANDQLKHGDLTTQGILRRFHVRALCTSDDPCDDLAHHRAIAKSAAGFRMYPTFRPDVALQVHQPEIFNAWINRLELASNVAVSSLRDFLDALTQRQIFSMRMAAGFRTMAWRSVTQPSAQRSKPKQFLRKRDGKGRDAGRTRAVRVLPDDVFRAAGRGQGLDEATAPGSAAQREHEGYAATRPECRL